MRVLAHDTDFAPYYNQLKKDPQKNKAMLGAIKNVKQQLEKSNRPLGAHHKKDQIPQSYKKKYNIQALYHFDMPSDHRLMYTVRKSPSGSGIEVLLLQLLTHDEYNKLFGYFKKKSH